MALIAEARGDLDHAEALHRESLAINVEVQNGPGSADSLLALGRLLAGQRGNPEEACGLLRQAVTLRRDLGLPGVEEAEAALQTLGCPPEA